MRHRAHKVANRAVRAVWAVGAVRAVPAVRLAPAVRAVALALATLAAGATVAGCATAPATAGTAAASRPAATRAAPAYGPVAPDAACVAAKQAEATLQSRQDKDQGNESALDQDLTNFATALSDAAQRERHQVTAQAMIALANDYTALVQSQSGAAQLPAMSQVQKDGAAFDKACAP